MEFLIGLEVERHRIDSQGQISPFGYPENIGNQQTNPWITNDFMETMSEVVTPAAKTPQDALSYLENLSNVLRNGLHAGELLWPLSMPPALPRERKLIDIAHASAEKRQYFFNWLKSHELQEATPCGMHVNLGINPKLTENLTIAEINQLYIKLAQGFLHYRFVLTYFFGASPLGEKNYFLDSQGPEKLVRSIRQSKYGFGTKYTGEFQDVEHYQARILTGIQRGELLAEHDFHSPVRLRRRGSIKELHIKGTEYLELRMLDLNPWSSVGISSDELDLLLLMAAYFLVTPANTYDLQKFNQLNEEVALETPTEQCQYQDMLLAFLSSLEQFAAIIQVNQRVYDLLERLIKIAHQPDLTISGRLVREIQNDSLTPFAIKQSETFQARSMLAHNFYKGFTEGRIPSAQELIRDISAL